MFHFSSRSVIHVMFDAPFFRSFIIVFIIGISIFCFVAIRPIIVDICLSSLIFCSWSVFLARRRFSSLNFVIIFIAFVLFAIPSTNVFITFLNWFIIILSKFRGDHTSFFNWLLDISAVVSFPLLFSFIVERIVRFAKTRCKLIFLWQTDFTLAKFTT